MKALFLPQNDTHLVTSRLLAAAMKDRGWQTVVLDMDDVFRQGLEIEAGNEFDRVIRIPHRPTQAFYRLPAVRQAQTVLRLAPVIRKGVEGVQSVIAFNDGSLQRVALSAGRRIGARTTVVLDGMISNYKPPSGLISAGRQALEAFGRRAAPSWLGTMLPSDIGMYPVDDLYVIGPHSAEVLRQSGSLAGRIVPSGIPRWPEGGDARVGPVRRVLYLTCAFAWHADHESQAAQMQDVAVLDSAAAELGLDLTVRVHPRDDPDAYREITSRVVTASDRPMGHDIRAADLVVSMLSTGLLEAITLGRAVHGMALNADWSRFSRSWIGDSALATLRTVSDLRLALSAAQTDGTATLLSRQRAALDRFVTGGGRQAVGRIVGDLAMERPPR